MSGVFRHVLEICLDVRWSHACISWFGLLQAIQCMCALTAVPTRFSRGQHELTEQKLSFWNWIGFGFKPQLLLTIEQGAPSNLHVAAHEMEAVQAWRTAVDIWTKRRCEKHSGAHYACRLPLCPMQRWPICAFYWMLTAAMESQLKNWWLSFMRTPMWTSSMNRQGFALEMEYLNILKLYSAEPLVKKKGVMCLLYLVNVQKHLASLPFTKRVMSDNCETELNFDSVPLLVCPKVGHTKHCRFPFVLALPLRKGPPNTRALLTGEPSD